MPFHSLVFLYVFLPVALIGFWKLRAARARCVWLTLTGFLFYAAWSWKYVWLMAASTALAYAAGLAIARFGPRRWCVALPVAADLVLLAGFKWAGAAGVAELPLGISFYTFHTISYVIDCWRGAVRPARGFFEFAAYVSFFPQLVAGPITRFGQVVSDLRGLDRAEERRDFEQACSCFAIGLAKKVLLADSIAAVIDPGFAQWSSLTAADAWLCVLGYAYQLYFDFSGYSDMAVGLGLAFGIRLPVNFNSPFQAVDIADFWRRWHISLSTALRDYVYRPFGGGRSRAHRNIWITMLLCGLWHGASWPCLLWGAYNAALLSLHRIAPVRWGRAATFAAFVFGLAIFRGVPLGRLFGGEAGVTLAGASGLAVLLAVAALLSHVGPNTSEMTHRWEPARALAMAALFAVSMGAIYAGRQSPFLYFQF